MFVITYTWWSLCWVKSRSWTSLLGGSAWLSALPLEDSLVSELGDNESWRAPHSLLHLPPHQRSCCPSPPGSSVQPPSYRSPQKGRNHQGCPQSLTSTETHCPWTLIIKKGNSLLCGEKFCIWFNLNLTFERLILLILLYFVYLLKIPQYN